MRLVYAEDMRVRSWMRERMPVQLMNALPAIGVAKDDGTLIAGTALVSSHKHDGVWIDQEWAMCADAPIWARPRILREWFAYPFHQVGCARVTMRTAEGNALMRRTAEHMGFREEGRLRGGFDGKQDFIIYGMLRGECPWLEGNHV